MENPDMALGVQFFTQPVENLNASREAGRPIYEDKEFVKISFPADSKRELVAPAAEMHYVSHAKQQMTYAQRFSGSYEAFKAQQADYIAGTPLAVLPGLTEARREELKALKVFTVEQLAGMPDSSRKRLGMGAMELQERAKSFLDQANGAAATDALQRQVAELQAQLAAMQGKSQKAAEPDPFDGLEDDDLKNMIQDATGERPRGNPNRSTLIAKLQEIAAAKEDAA